MAQTQEPFEYYEVIGFAPAGGEMVQVVSKIIFRKFDGFDWQSRPLKDYPRFFFEDMMKAIKLERDEGIIRVRNTSPIAISCHIKCSDSIHQGEFQTLGGFALPIIFNNSCASSHELAASFVGAGARAYIGTLWRIGNETASHAAIVFYEQVLQHGNCIDAFHKMNQSVTSERYKNVYIFWGLHFSSLSRPANIDDDAVLDRLLASFFLWLNKIQTTSDPEIKRNSIPIARFLLEQVTERLSPERHGSLRDLEPGTLERVLEGLPPSPEDQFSRGLKELEVIENNG